MNAIELFDRTAERLGAAPAIVGGRRPGAPALSFAALAERSRRIATLLTQEGLAPGDAVVVLLPVSRTFFAVTAALVRAGLVAVFVDPAQWRVTLAAALAGARVRGIVGSPAALALRWCLPGLRRIPHVFVAGHWPGARSLAAAHSLPPLAAPVQCASDAVALVSFTSGTTGSPKGVLRTHGVLVATQRLLAGTLELRAGETHLSVLPLVLLASLAAGATSVLADGDLSRPARLDPTRLAAQVRAQRVAVIVASPMVADRLAGHAIATAPFESVRRVYLGGAPVLPPLIDRWRLAAPGAGIHVLYGATEAEPIAALAAADYGDAERQATRRGGGVLVGLPVQQALLRILADHSGSAVGPCTEAALEALTVPPGVEGEIVVAGEHVAPGFLAGTGDPLAGIEAGARRWHRTGDAGYFDARGRLWLTGRCSSGVTIGATAIHALRVEAALAFTMGVAHAALLPQGDRRLVVVEPERVRAPLPIGEIAAAVAFAHPDEIAVIDRLPMDARHHAKVDYRRLAAAIAAGELRQRWPLGRGESTDVDPGGGP